MFPCADRYAAKLDLTPGMTLILKINVFSAVSP